MKYMDVMGVLAECRAITSARRCDGAVMTARGR